MPDRALRNLREDINKAYEQVKRWRLDGNGDQIEFWIKRMNELLERFGELSAQEDAAT